jgi:hypothetical protein
MDALWEAAARAAGARAASCRARREQLARRSAFGAGDPLSARAELARAEERAALATIRLGRARSQRRDRISGRSAGDGETDRCDSSSLRQAARQLPLSALYPSYLSVGGRCTEFELEAFIHEALELPADECSVLGYAVWELTTFGG